MGLFTGADKYEKQQQANSWNNLSNIASSSLSSAKGLEATGKENTGVATDFFRGVAKGDRTAMAPAINAVTESADAAKREQAQMGTARGGGASSYNQQVEQKTREVIANLMGQSQAGAATELANIGGNETQSMLSALGISSGTESNLSSALHQDISEKNASAAKMWGALIGGGMKLAGTALFH